MLKQAHVAPEFRQIERMPPMPHKILLPIGDATEVMDTLYPIFRLPEDGFEVVIAGPEAEVSRRDARDSAQ